jgi:hypothetical protein
MSSHGDNNLYMLYYFLLIFPKGFKGVLTTYQIQLSSYFSHRVFGGEILKMMTFKMIEYLQRAQLFTRTSSYISKKTFKTMREDLKDCTRDFQETALSKGEC